MKSTGTAYLLAIIGLLSPVAGIHRFYLGRTGTALLYLFTWGFFGIGTILDLVHMQRLVDDENRRQLFPGPPLHYLSTGLAPAARALPAPKEVLTTEQKVLRVARDHGGAVTVAMVSVETGMTLRDAKKELERLRKEEFCTVDVSSEGAKLYVFEGLKSNQPLDLS
jgi:TM2 domain